MIKTRITFLLASSVILGACSGNGSDSTTTVTTGAPDGTAIDLDVAYTHPSAVPINYKIQCSAGVATVTPADAGIDASAACARLAAPEAVTLLTQGPEPDRMCTMIYGGPDEAAITGTLAGATVDVVITRADGCGINDWDVVLAGVLPQAIGAIG